VGVIGKTLRFTLGLALGAGIGAVAAMLAAPQSGRATKEQIQHRMDEILQAGKTAQNEREKELLDYWEQQLALKEQRSRNA
jgi:gas vesicle protein